MQKSDKNRVLILGGTGFIGRHLVTYLANNDLASQITVVDKVLPQLAWFNEEHKKAFTHSIVEYKSANLIIPESCQAIFSDKTYDYVVNLASETRPGLALSVYKEGIVKLSQNCAHEAAKQRVKKYIEFSSSQMYSSNKAPAIESSKSEPWTPQGRCKFEVEKELKNIPNLNWTIVRPALVYGAGDKQSLVPRLSIGAIYKHLQELMKLLWTKDLYMNTVHVYDVCRAICHLLPLPSATEQIYNLVDKSNSTQGSITKLIAAIFNIEYDFLGTAKSLLAKVDFNSLVEEVNDTHLSAWAELCNQNGIANTPLTPYLYPELLSDKGIHLDGAKLEESGFHYDIPVLKESALKEVLDDYISMGLFPRSSLG